MALSLLAANNAQTVLAAGISSTATSLTVNAGTGTLFPSPVAGTSFFKLTIIDAATGSLTEIIHVTARNGDVFTIQRGQEGTVPRAWSANDIAANMMTAGTLSYILGNFQPLDPTLTALATLVGAANKLPYFNGDDTAALTNFTQVGRDIIGKNTIADILTYLGLPELFADEKRFHTSPESVEMITPNGEIIIELTNNGYVNVINKSTGLLAEIPPTGLEQQAGSHQKRMMSQKGVTDLVKSVETPVGMFATFPHRATQLPPKWYSTNGDRFSVSSPQGLALKSLPAELKSDWGITESGGMINVPNIKQSDGRAPFLRPVNGTNRQVGSVDGDKMRRIYGEYANSSWRDPGDGWGSASGVFGVRYDSGVSGSTGSNKGTVLVFDTNKVVDTGPEFKPLDIGVTLAVYLGA